MKNKNFFYQQYDKINWENQEKTKINSLIYQTLIKDVISKEKGPNIKIFDIGLGIGFFMKILAKELKKSYKNILLEGCEPSDKNYNYLVKNLPKTEENIKIRTHHKSFQNVQINERFDFIVATYVFPHFASDDLEKIAKKIYSMLNKRGKFILVVANEKYLEKKLKNKKDLFIENNIIYLNRKNYKEILHYSHIPEIGKIIDYNREEQFYSDLFKRNKFKLNLKKDLNDCGFIATVFVFEKGDNLKAVVKKGEIKLRRK